MMDKMVQVAASGDKEKRNARRHYVEKPFDR
jgi:hypothetical protein